MGERIHPPAPNPCGSCPYRRDVPSGVWDQLEYDKLPDYDRDTADQPPSVFMCHQQDGRLCAGWVACHDMANTLGFRVALGMGLIEPDDVSQIVGYVTSTPIFGSGKEAAEHGSKEIMRPSEKAMKTVASLDAKRKRKEKRG